MEDKSAKFNMRNPAVKRIMQEIKEMQDHSSSEFIAQALEDDIFEWDFVVRGPPETDFEGGVYHGRILLPPEYPFKPPAFMMLTPNGRFETGVKICLSISSHHPEHWQPSWSVRTALTAMIAFMPTPGLGALGSLDYPSEERRSLALKSRTEIPKFGSAERQKIIDELHHRMLEVHPEKGSSSETAPTTAQPVADSVAPQPVAAAPAPHVCAAMSDTTTVSPAPPPASAAPQASMLPEHHVHVQQGGDKGLTLLAIALTMGIIAILLKKAFTVWGGMDAQLMGS